MSSTRTRKTEILECFGGVLVVVYQLYHAGWLCRVTRVSQAQWTRICSELYAQIVHLKLGTFVDTLHETKTDWKARHSPLDVLAAKIITATQCLSLHIYDHAWISTLTITKLKQMVKVLEPRVHLSQSVVPALYKGAQAAAQFRNYQQGTVLWCRITEKLLARFS